MRHSCKYICLITLLLLLLNEAFSQTGKASNFLTGKAHLESGQYDSALIYLERSIESDPRNDDAVFYKGMALYSKSQYAMAIQEFDKVEKNSKGKASIWIARSYAQLKDTQKCLQALDIHLNSNYRLPESTLLLDPVLSKLENDPLYIEFWKNGNWYTGFDKTIAEAGYLINSKKFPEAIDVLSAGLKAGYRKSPLYAKRAEVYMRVGNDKLALDDLNKALEMDSRNPELLEQRAVIQYRTGKYKSSLEDYNRAVKIAPKELRLYLGRAMALNKIGDYEAAKNDMNLYLQYYPGNDSAWYQFGMINYENENYLDAINCFNNSLKISQNDYRYFAGRGAAYLKTRTYTYAWKDLAMAIDLNPRDSESYVNKGIAAVNTGKMDDACFCFGMGKKLGNKEAFNYAEKYCK